MLFHDVVAQWGSEAESENPNEPRMRYQFRRINHQQVLG